MTDVHIYEKGTGKFIKTLRDVQPGQVFDGVEDPGKVDLKYEDIPPTRWPEGAEL